MDYFSRCVDPLEISFDIESCISELKPCNQIQAPTRPIGVKIRTYSRSENVLIVAHSGYRCHIGLKSEIEKTRTEWERQSVQIEGASENSPQKNLTVILTELNHCTRQVLKLGSREVSDEPVAGIEFSDRALRSVRVCESELLDTETENTFEA